MRSIFSAAGKAMLVFLPKSVQTKYLAQTD
jgi:hypothetical protein